MLFFFFKQKTAYEMRISDWSSDVFSSDLARLLDHRHADARFAVEHPAHAIILAAEFDPRHILEPRDRAILRVGLDADIGELLGRDHPALHVDRQFEGRIALADRKSTRPNSSN